VVDRRYETSEESHGGGVVGVRFLVLATHDLPAGVDEEESKDEEQDLEPIDDGGSNEDEDESENEDGDRD